MRIARWLPVVAISLVLAACGATSAPLVTLPGPKHVVVAYTAARNAKDKAAARPLLTRSFARLTLNDSGKWFDGRVKITDLRISKQFYDAHFRYGAFVAASFVVADHHAGAMVRRPDAETFYLLRQGPTDPWLIDEEGKRLADPLGLRVSENQTP